MVKLSEAEKKELLKLSRSQQLRHDLDGLTRRNRKLSAAQYVEFVTTVNALFGHKPKKFERMTGDHFIL